jgi:hypothetical protein
MRDVFDPRSTRGGVLMKNTKGYNGDMYVESDSRDAVVYGAGANAGRTESGGYIVSVYPSVQWKPTSGISLSCSPSFTRDVTIAQWVDNHADTLASRTFGQRHIFGKLDLTEISASVRMDWTFSPVLSLQLYVQPLVSVGRYNEFKELRQPGTYTFVRYGVDDGSTVTPVEDGYRIDPDGTGRGSFTLSNPDFNFKSLRGSAVLRWEYLPGSTLYLVWTRSGTDNANPGDLDFGRDVGRLFATTEREDAFLLKLSYWWNP